MSNSAATVAFQEVLDDYVVARQLDDGRWIGVQRLMYHFTLHVGIDSVGYMDRFCIASLAMAMDAFESWDGTGEPKWWHKHPSSGRYRDLESGAEWTAAEEPPDAVKGVDWPYNFEPDLAQTTSPAP